MARHRLRLAARIIGWILLSFVGLITAVIVAVLIVGRTDWGRQKMLATLLPVIQGSLTGELRVGKLEGDLVHTLAVSRRTMRIVRQNLVWALVYNATCVPLALLGWLPPWAAGLGMASSSLVVILNALRAAR